LAIGAALLPWSLRDIGGQRGYVVQAGQWIGQQYPPSESLAIVAEDGLVAFYADRYADWVRADSARDVLDRVGPDRRALLVARTDKPSWLPADPDCRLRGVRLEKLTEFRHKANGQGVGLYIVLPDKPRPENAAE
jgi:hypothetical protein